MSPLSPVGYFRAIQEVLRILADNKQLLVEMTRREVIDRYAGQVFGALWTIGHPLALMAVYVFVFAFVFKARVGGTRELPFDYTTYLLSGLIPWMAFQEAMSKGTVAITRNSNLVKQVVFPIEILPATGAIAASITQLIMLSLLTLYIFVRYGSVHFSFLLLLPLVICQCFCMMGIAFILSSIGAYFRDLKDFVQVFCVAGMYTMPIFFLPKWVPPLLQPILYLNPFSYMVWCFQDAVYFGRFVHWWAWPVFLLGSFFVFAVGYRLFRRCKLFFGSIL